ncbi:MAG TPA: phage head-tail connector protein [Elusimicrobiales bacterium]|nr:phage head-tail connector protein [Elusimicrobiales bacterium]
MIPTQWVMTLAEAKTYLGLTGTAQDTALSALLSLVTRQLENYLELVFIKRDVSNEVYTVPYQFSCAFFIKQNLPVNSISKIELKDSSLAYVEKYGTTAGTDTFDYSKNGTVRRINSYIETRPDGVRVSYNGGLCTAIADIPDEIKAVAGNMLKLQWDVKFANGGKIQSESLGDYSYTLATATDYPPFILTQLEALSAVKWY